MSSIIDFYQDSPYAKFPQEHRSAGSFPAKFMRVEQDAHDLADPPFEELVLVLGLRADMPYRIDLGDGWAGTRFGTGSLTVLPPRTAVRYECPGPHEILVAAFDMRPIQAALEPHGLSVDDFRPLFSTPAFEDKTIRRLLTEMWAASFTNGPANGLLVDGLSRNLFASLLQRSDAGPFAGDPRLTAPMKRLLIDYIDERLDQPMTVLELANLVGLSAFSFARRFKQAFGQSPHQFVLARRVERAQALLAEGLAPLAEIALDCGFASQSHMTDVFRARLGVTPGRYRKDRRQ